MAIYKVTTQSYTYTHYFVEADNAEAAEMDYCNFKKCEEDPLHGDNDETVLEVNLSEDEI